MNLTSSFQRNQNGVCFETPLKRVRTSRHARTCSEHPRVFEFCSSKPKKSVDGRACHTGVRFKLDKFFMRAGRRAPPHLHLPPYRRGRESISMAYHFKSPPPRWGRARVGVPWRRQGKRCLKRLAPQKGREQPGFRSHRNFKPDSSGSSTTMMTESRPLLHRDVVAGFGGKLVHFFFFSNFLLST